MSIDVIIPTYKPDGRLLNLLEKLFEQTVPINKIILMNTEQKYLENLLRGSKYSGMHKQLEIRHVSAWEFDHGKTRSAGADGSEADFLLYMTQDATPEDETLVEHLLKPFDDPMVASAYARQIPCEDATIDERFSREFNYPEESMVKSQEDTKRLGIKTYFCSNACAMYRRSIFEQLGRFPSKMIFNEDMVYAHKLLINGYKIKYENNAMVYHTHEYSGIQQFKRNFDLAVSQKMNSEAFDGISSEAEGIKYVRAAALYFIKNGHPFAIFPFVIKCVYKYAGYRKGKSYEKLSNKQIMKYTGNKEFWINRK